MDDLTKGLIEHLRKSDPGLEVVETPQFLSVKDFHSVSWEKPMPTNERDTKFLGFANREIDRLEQKRLIPIHPKSLRNDMATILAQCAYDLAVHVMNTVPPIDQDWPTVREWEWDIHDIPDLTQWSTTPDSPTPE